MIDVCKSLCADCSLRKHPRIDPGVRRMMHNTYLLLQYIELRKESAYFILLGRGD